LNIFFNIFPRIVIVEGYEHREVRISGSFAGVLAISGVQKHQKS